MRKINLSIPKPCHENWDNMSQEQKGRFCGSCRKTVVDFTNVSDRELAQFFKKPAGSVCGRFHQDQLDRDIEIPKKRIPWVKYFFQFALPAFLVSMKASAQKTPITKGDTVVCRNITLGMVAMPRFDNNKPKEITGAVYDEYGKAIPFVTIKLKGENKTTTTDAQGGFKLKTGAEKNNIIVSAMGYEIVEAVATTQAKITIILPAVHGELMGKVVMNTATTRLPIVQCGKELNGKVVNEIGDAIPYASISLKKSGKSFACDSTGNFKIEKISDETTLVATAIGYNETEVSIKISDTLKIVMQTKFFKLDDISITSQALMGRMGGVSVRGIRAQGETSIIKKIIDSAFSRFSVYPNPVREGSLIKLALKKVAPGNYLVSVINTGGAVVQNKEIIVANKYEVQDFSLSATAVGTYFIRLANATTGKAYTEKIVVQ